MPTNEYDQPIGAPVPGWKGVERPPRTPMRGRFCTVEAIDPAHHADDLYRAYALEPSSRNFTYLTVGPFDSFDAYMKWITSAVKSEDPLFHAIVDAGTGKAVGIASYMRLDPTNGVIEVGHLNYSPLLQRKPAATEAMYLMMKRAFDLGYRRYEWKCDSLNAPSRAAAQRLGFSYEGIFRQASVYKGRNRDTAWYAMIEKEWPELDRAFRRWLDPGNFDAQGQQRERLSDLTGPILKQRG
jgi:RimJ/RimL family protein N-acetyltransferase